MGTAKRLRIAELERQRLERLAKGELDPSKLEDLLRHQMVFRCGKCKNFVVESAVNAHMAKCQPKGTECGKCKKLITDPDFVGHFKSCTGRPKEEPQPVDIPENK